MGWHHSGQLSICYISKITEWPWEITHNWHVTKYRSHEGFPIFVGIVLWHGIFDKIQQKILSMYVVWSFSAVNEDWASRFCRIAENVYSCCHHEDGHLKVQTVVALYGMVFTFSDVLVHFVGRIWWWRWLEPQQSSRCMSHAPGYMLWRWHCAICSPLCQRQYQKCWL
jgi:hypothetical protein